MTSKKKSQTGFSLVEMVMVVFLLTIIVGAIFSQIEKAQSRYKVENQRLDLTQQERDFVDQFTRDLHQAGFPTAAMYGNRFDINSAQVSAGIWYVSATDVWMEGDLDDNERVQETRYHYDDGSTWDPTKGPNPCPCIRRSSVPKIDGYYPWDSHQTNPQYYTEVQNLIPVANQPLFQIYDGKGQAVPMSGGSLLLGNQSLGNIKAIRITLTTQSSTPDSDAHQTIQVTMNGTARLPNN
jgi:type II secretory pathway pseudopilin PulG